MPKGKPRTHAHAPSLSPGQAPAYLLHQQPQQSQSQALPLQTHYQTRTTASLNLSVLQRHNPYISHILSIAPFAVVYTFTQSTVQSKEPGWEKTGVEGTLFVVALDHQDGNERYGVMVLNRKGLENFEMELHRTEDVEVSGEFVIIQGQDEDEEMGITGLWIFANHNGEGGGGSGNEQSQEDLRSLIAGVITECAGRAEASQKRLGEYAQPNKRRGYGAMGFDGAEDETNTNGADVLQSLFARARSGQTA
ncbi:MAG: hypothetical protein Q9162_006081 [Coniocarpon cinnabarinum]